MSPYIVTMTSHMSITQPSSTVIDPLEMFFGTESTRYSIESKSSGERDRTFSTMSSDSVDPCPCTDPAIELELTDIESAPSKPRAITMSRKRDTPAQEVAKTPTPSKYYTIMQTNCELVASLSK